MIKLIKIITINLCYIQPFLERQQIQGVQQVLGHPISMFK